MYDNLDPLYSRFDSLTSCQITAYKLDPLPCFVLAPAEYPYLAAFGL
jgi:hypothetical protein